MSVAAPPARVNGSALLIGAAIVVAAMIIGTALLIIRTSPPVRSVAAPTCAELAESEVFHGSIMATPGGSAPAEVPTPAGRAVTRCDAKFNGGDSVLTVVAFAGVTAASYDREMTAAGWTRVGAPDGTSYTDLAVRYDVLVFVDFGDLVVAYLPFG